MNKDLIKRLLAYSKQGPRDRCTTLWINELEAAIADFQRTTRHIAIQIAERMSIIRNQGYTVINDNLSDVSTLDSIQDEIQGITSSNTLPALIERLHQSIPDPNWYDTKIAELFTKYKELYAAPRHSSELIKTALDKVENHSQFSNLSTKAFSKDARRAVEVDTGRENQVFLTVEMNHNLTFKWQPRASNDHFSYTFGPLRFGFAISTGSGSSSPRVIAVAEAINPSKQLKEIYGHCHPHVSTKNVVCAGEAREALKNAASDLNLLEYFEILYSLLKTYNHPGAFSGGLKTIYQATGRCACCNNQIQAGTVCTTCSYSLRPLHSKCTTINEATGEAISPAYCLTKHGINFPISKADADKGMPECDHLEFCSNRAQQCSTCHA